MKMLSFTVMVALCGSLLACRHDEPSAEKKAAATPAEPAEAQTSADTGTPPDRITLSPDVQQRLGIVATPAATVALAVVLPVTGSVQPIESRVGHVRPIAHGRIQDVAVKMGDRVERGQVLATFDNIEAGELTSQYKAARAELARLQAQLTAATRQAERSRKLAEIGAVPQRELEAAQSEHQQLTAAVQGQEATISGLDARLRRYGAATGGAESSSLSIQSPLAGVVIRVAAAPGDVVDPSSDLFAVADVSRVYVQAQLYERDLGRVRTGQEASVTVEAYPGEHFHGRVVAIGDVVDIQTRTVAVRCELDNARRLLKLDMLAKVDLPTIMTAPALALPDEAIQTHDDRPIVFVKSGPSEFVARSIEIGRSAAGQTEVTKGLSLGDVVVTRGAFQVKSAWLSKHLREKDKGRS